MAMASDQTQKIPQFDAMRRRLQGQFSQKKQETSDAIQRRYAANGMASSGAYGKAQDQAARQANLDEADAQAQLDLAEANEVQRRVEVAEGRQYQTKEREASQGFASSERQASQIFNKELFDRDMAFKEITRNLDNVFREKEFAASEQANKTNEFVALGGDKAGPAANKQYEQAMYRRYGPSWREFK